MEVFNIHEAKAKLSRILRRVEQGHEVLIARDGVVIARIVPQKANQRIQLGRDEGRGALGADFDAPLPEFEEYQR